MSYASSTTSPFGRRRSASKHKEVCEKYQIQYSSQPKLHTKGLPPRHPPFERPTFRLSSPAPPSNPKEDWRMPLTQYRKATKYPEHVPTYEQSILALSRRIRNKSLPPLPDYRDCSLPSQPTLMYTALGRQFPARLAREDHSLGRRNHSSGSPVCGGPGYLGSGVRRPEDFNLLEMSTKKGMLPNM
eukprot:GFUD01052868.1.p1 GENE.GFUD01052868.1~~GFUD01052868.1.p1  ORF type:complete len:200 (+),score=43.27 GFUD01052868.1:43-600(+)